MGTNDKAEYDAVIRFRDAAVADGWELTAVYESEPKESYGHLAKDGFTAHVCARVRDEMEKLYPHMKNERLKTRYAYEVGIHIWGPDGLCIEPPTEYSMPEIMARTRMCESCKAKDVDTVRYSFAGRCCEKCLPAMRAQHEQRGWCD